MSGTYTFLVSVYFAISLGASFDLFPKGTDDPSYWQNNMFTPEKHDIDVSSENWSNKFVEFAFVPPVISNSGCEYSFRRDGTFLKQGHISYYLDYDGVYYRTAFKIVFLPGDVPQGTQVITLHTRCAINRYATVFAPNAWDGASYVIDLRMSALPTQDLLINPFATYGSSVFWDTSVSTSPFYYYGPGHSGTSFITDVDTLTDSDGLSKNAFWRGEAMLDLESIIRDMDRPVIEVQWYKDEDSLTELTIQVCPLPSDCSTPNHFTEVIAEYILESDDHETGYGLIFAALERLQSDTAYAPRLLIDATDEAPMAVFPYVRIWDAGDLSSDPTLLDLRWEDDFLQGEFASNLDVSVHPDCLSDNSDFVSETEFMHTGHYINCEWRRSEDDATCGLGANGMVFDRVDGPLFLEADFPVDWHDKPRPVMEFYISANEPGASSSINCDLLADGPDHSTTSTISYHGVDIMTAFDLTIDGVNYYTTPEWARIGLADDVPFTLGWQTELTKGTQQFQTGDRMRLEAFGDPDASSIIMHSYVKLFSGGSKLCLDNPCENGGTCVPYFSNTELCECPEGYSGDTCEMVDPCLGVTCENQGLCNEGECLCRSGFYGSACQYDEGEWSSAIACETNPCENGAVCVAYLSGRQHCECVDGWIGDNCQTEGPCVGIVCENGGECKEGRCYCSGGFIGENCEFDVADFLSAGQTTTTLGASFFGVLLLALMQ